MDRNVEVLERQITRLSKRHECSSVLHESVESLHPFVTEATPVVRWRRLGVTTLHHHAPRVGRQDDDVPTLVQVTAQNLGVHDRAVRIRKVLEKEARPAFVHVAAVVALEHADPLLGHRVGAARPVTVERGKVYTGLLRDVSDRRSVGTRPDNEITHPEAVAVRTGAAYISARCEEHVHRFERIVQAAIQYIPTRTHGNRSARIDLRRQPGHRSHDCRTDRLDIHSHELGNVVRSHVVRANRIALTVAGICVVRIERPAEQPADEASLRLCHRNHVAAACIGMPFVLEVSRGTIHRDSLENQLVHHFLHGERVVLVGGNDVGLHVTVDAALRLPRRLVVGIPENCLAILRSELKWRERRYDLALHDVADVPPTAFPHAWKRCLRLILRELTRSAKLVRVHIQRSRQTRARRLGQHPRDVVKGRNPVEAEVAPTGVDRRTDRAHELFLVHLIRHL